MAWAGQLGDIIVQMFIVYQNKIAVTNKFFGPIAKGSKDWNSSSLKQRVSLLSNFSSVVSFVSEELGNRQTEIVLL